jgi:CheY-like chemotaxis protein
MNTRKGVSVLIVDDDADICETFAEVLEDAGFVVAYARDGAEALERLKSVRPELILLDLNMPNMSGQAFVRAQRADPAIRGIPTVVMTAGHLDLPVPAESVVAKPVGLQQLVDIVARHCHRRRG